MKSYSVNFCDYTIGCEAYEEVHSICKIYGKRIILIGGKRAIGAGKKFLLHALKDSDLEIVETIDSIKECTKSSMKECAKLAKEMKADMIFGMGGGKAIDTAKGVANLLSLPVFTFPTIAATCAATTALSVVYKESGAFDCFEFYESPAKHTFIELDIIKEAPTKYLRAGMGDTIGKHFECHFAARGDLLLHSSVLGREISNLCYFPLLEHGKQGLLDCELEKATESLRQVVLANIVSTGMVSLLVLDQYNCALAHSLYYGLVLLPGFEEKYLHGDVVAYGVLVQLAVDKKFELLEELKTFLQEIKVPTTLKEMQVEVSKENLDLVLKETVEGPDMEHIPYEITKDMVYDAIVLVEQY